MRAALLLPLLLAAAASGDPIGNPRDHDTTLEDNPDSSQEFNTRSVLTTLYDDPGVLLFGNDTIFLTNNSILLANGTLLIANDTIFNINDTVVNLDLDGEHAPVVRKKRTFGDIVFRGLADALGYSVQRKPAQAAFPPPLDPVPGIDFPLQAGAPPPAPPPPAPCCAPPPPPPPPPPCCAPPPPPPKPRPPPPPPPCCAPPPPPPKPRPPPPPPPCCAPPPPPPKPRPPPPPPPCPKPPPPPKPKPKPPPPPPCPAPKPNPQAPPPCGPPPKRDEDTIVSNLQFSLNFGRQRATPAPAPQAEAFVPIAFEPTAALLPAEEPRRPRVYTNVNDDYLYDDEDASVDDYDDSQEARPRVNSALKQSVAKFWEKKVKPKKSKAKEKLADNHYKNVHFGDRDFLNNIRRSDRSQSIKREERNQEDEEDAESTTTTEDPRRPLRPRVLPPTEQNPGQIDTVTVRVPPIYREKRPKKYNRAPPERDEDDEDGRASRSDENEADSDGEYNVPRPFTEKPIREQRRKKLRRTRRATEKTDSDEDDYSSVAYDYYGKKIPVSDEEKSFYEELRLPEPTKDTDLARIEDGEGGDFLDDHERLSEDPEREDEDERMDDDGRADDSGRSDAEKERSVEDPERDNEEQRADSGERGDSKERSDVLSPQAQIHETGYQKNYLSATNVQRHDPKYKKIHQK